MKDNPWTGVDFDGTLAKHIEGSGVEDLGQPIPEMVARVKKMLREGRVVKIMTARVGNTTAGQVKEQTAQIEAWCEKYIGQKLEVTATKDYNMVELYDDRAVQIIPNTGRRADGKA